MNEWMNKSLKIILAYNNIVLKSNHRTRSHHSFIHSFINSFIHSLISSFIHLFKQDITAHSRLIAWQWEISTPLYSDNWNIEISSIRGRCTRGFWEKNIRKKTTMQLMTHLKDWFLGQICLDILSECDPKIFSSAHHDRLYPGKWRGLFVVYDSERSPRDHWPAPLPEYHCPSLVFESRFECGNLRQVRRTYA